MEVDQASRSGLERPLERGEGAVELAQSRLAHRQALRPDVVLARLLLQPGHDLLRLVAPVQRSERAYDVRVIGAHARLEGLALPVPRQGPFRLPPSQVSRPDVEVRLEVVFVPLQGPLT